MTRRRPRARAGDGLPPPFASRAGRPRPAASGSTEADSESRTSATSRDSRVRIARSTRSVLPGCPHPAASRPESRAQGPQAERPGPVGLSRGLGLRLRGMQSATIRRRRPRQPVSLSSVRVLGQGARVRLPEFRAQARRFLLRAGEPAVWSLAGAQGSGAQFNRDPRHQLPTRAAIYSAAAAK